MPEEVSIFIIACLLGFIVGFFLGLIINDLLK